jgi:hypothetical protein
MVWYLCDNISSRNVHLLLKCIFVETKTAIWQMQDSVELAERNNGVLLDIVCRLYKGILYCQTVTWFHGTCVCVVLFMPIRNVWPSICQFWWKLQIPYSVRCGSVAESKDRNGFMSVSEIWLLLCWFLQNSQSLNSSLWKSSALYLPTIWGTNVVNTGKMLSMPLNKAWLSLKQCSQNWRLLNFL